MVIYRFKTELSGERTKYSNAIFTTGDIRGYRLIFEFTQDGKKADLTGSMLSVKAKRADGIVIIDSGVVTENEAYYDIKSSMIATPGDVSFEIALADSDGMYLTALELIAFVREGHGEEDLKAAETTPVLSTLLTAAEKAVRSTLSAEKAAQDAEQAAQDAIVAAEKAQNYKYVEKNIEFENVIISLLPNTITHIKGAFDYVEADGIHFACVDGETDAEDMAEEYVMILNLANVTTLPAFLFANDIKWFGGEPPELEIGKTYMFSFTKIKGLFFLGVGGEFC